MIVLHILVRKLAPCRVVKTRHFDGVDFRIGQLPRRLRRLWRGSLRGRATCRQERGIGIGGVVVNINPGLIHHGL